MVPRHEGEPRRDTMGRTILVTGAAGFIGSHVAQMLLARGDTVVGLDNLNDYYNPDRKRANLIELRRSSPQGSNLQFIEGDIRDRPLLARLFRENSFAAVVHLAAMAGVRVSIEDPYLYFDVNVTGTMNLLNESRDRNVGNFVLASTSSVYGDTKQIPFVETDPCDRPLAPYATSKRAAEMLGFTYHHLYGLNVTALRFFTVYGPRGRPDMMAYQVLDHLFFGKKVTMFNNGQMHRDWTYVEDIAAGVAAAADRPLGYEVINLGRGEPTLLADFVHLIEELAGKKANLASGTMPKADIAYTFADVTKARNLVGYNPRVSVKEGVARFWAWYRETVLQKA
jgi:UDP-glucuronate 4-epimerase